MRTFRSRHHAGARWLLLSLVATAAFASRGPAQTAATNFTANKDLVLSTKTPLGDASVTIPSGTAVTNYEVQGGQVRIWQGPFSAVVALADVQPLAAPTPTPTPSPDATQESTPSVAPEPTAAPQNPTELSASSSSLPDWLLPAVVGALAAYALFATVALLRTRRRRAKSHSPSPSRAVKEAPVVTLPSKPKAKAAVVTDGGRAIACPLCGKTIPLEKISKGRNTCSSCQGTFVGE